MIRTYYDKKYNFKELFNTKTGFSIRSGILDKNGEGTEENPFMSSYPLLLDVGTMGTCNTGLNGKCNVKCYQSGNVKQEPNMSLNDFREIICQAEKGGTFSVALGGRGDPNKHEDFERLLRYARRSNIVPNYTTSGYELTDREVEITGKHVGAVALSEHFAQYTRDAIESFIAEGVKTNLHYVLSNDTIGNAIEMLKNDGFDRGLNAVIFLLYKPVGLQKTLSSILTPDDPMVKEFFQLIDKESYDFKIGLDPCSTPGVFNFTKNINRDSIDGCEAGLFSAFVTPDMFLLPCSFEQDRKYAVNLREFTIQEAWDSPEFEDFRSKLKKQCPKCENHEDCSICPIVPEITLCNRTEKEI